VWIFEDDPNPTKEALRRNGRRILRLNWLGGDCSAQSSAFLTGQNIELMGHPPYSPDLAPNDFFLYPHIELKVRGH